MQNGYIWNEYQQAIAKNNADQIYRQATIDLQQQKEIDLTNDTYQGIIQRQANLRLNINDDKISGDTDLTMIGINNLAKVEGIKSVAEDDDQVRFLAVMDGNETYMCHSLDQQTFYINKENVFDRYYGETQKDLRIQRIKCFGLVIGLNLPPISHHFHWCRSSITYQIPADKQDNGKDEEFIKNIKNKVKGIKKINIDKEKLIDRAFNNEIIRNIAKKDVVNDFYRYKEDRCKHRN